MKYTIQQADTATVLSSKVEALLSKGWELHGSLVVSITYNAYQGGVQYLYAQALIKRP